MRIYVQLDMQNLFFSAKDIGKRIDFLKIKDYIYNSGDNVVSLNAYIIRTPDAKSEKFEGLLKSLKYNLIIKQAIIGQSREGDRVYKGTDHDMAIAVDCMKNMDSFDKWILMSGDGDFIDLCRHLKKNKKFIEIWAVPGKSFNRQFCNYADSIVFLNDNFFYSKNDNVETTQPPTEGPTSTVLQ